MKQNEENVSSRKLCISYKTTYSILSCSVSKVSVIGKESSELENVISCYIGVMNITLDIIVPTIILAMIVVRVLNSVSW